MCTQVPEQLLSDALPDALGTVLDSSPFAPRAVEQRIDVTDRRVVNVVTLAPGPGGAFGASLGEALTSGLGLKDASIRLELDHTFSVEGEGGGTGRRRAADGSVVRLQLEQVRRKLASGEDGAADAAGPAAALASLIPRESNFNLPPPLSALSGGSFDTTYVDEGLRISRSGWPGNELRVFTRTVPAASTDGIDSFSEVYDGAETADADSPFEETYWDDDGGEWLSPSD